MFVDQRNATSLTAVVNFERKPPPADVITAHYIGCVSVVDDSSSFMLMLYAMNWKKRAEKHSITILYWKSFYNWPICEHVYSLYSQHTRKLLFLFWLCYRRRKFVIIVAVCIEIRNKRAKKELPSKYFSASDKRSLRRTNEFFSISFFTFKRGLRLTGVFSIFVEVSFSIPFFELKRGLRLTGD